MSFPSLFNPKCTFAWLINAFFYVQMFSNKRRTKMLGWFLDLFQGDRYKMHCVSILDLWLFMLFGSLTQFKCNNIEEDNVKKTLATSILDLIAGFFENKMLMSILLGFNSRDYIKRFNTARVDWLINSFFRVLDTGTVKEGISCSSQVKVLKCVMKIKLSLLRYLVKFDIKNLIFMIHD